MIIKYQSNFIQYVVHVSNWQKEDVQLKAKSKSNATVYVYHFDPGSEEVHREGLEVGGDELEQHPRGQMMAMYNMLRRGTFPFQNIYNATYSGLVLFTPCSKFV